MEGYMWFRSLLSNMVVAKNCVICMTLYSTMCMHWNPWAMSLLVHSWLHVLRSNWIQIQSSNGKSTETTQSKFPHYCDLLEFVNLRAQASEHTINDSSRRSYRSRSPFMLPCSTAPVNHEMCPLCKSKNHAPIYFFFVAIITRAWKGYSEGKGIAQVQKMSETTPCISSFNLILLHPHLKASLCWIAQLQYFWTLLPVWSQTLCYYLSTSDILPQRSLDEGMNTACYPGSSASFISERLSRSLQLRHHPTLTHISEIAGLSPTGSTHS